MAGYFGLSLRECMEKHTHREYRTWQQWYRDQFFVPERTDFYLMQIAAWVAQQATEGKAPTDVNEYMLKDASQPTKRKYTEEEKELIKQRARYQWASFAGKKLPPQKKD